MADWDGISEFANVVELKSFTKAAHKMGLSVAQVSRKVSSLESRLNVKLLHRTTRQISVTEEGLLFFEQCRNMIENLREAERLVVNSQQKPQGKIKISAPVTYGEQAIIPLVNSFMATYDDIQVSVYLTNRHVDLIEEGFDLAIRLGKLNNDRLIAKSLGKRSRYTCASPEYLAVHGMPNHVKDLARYRCIVGTRDYWTFRDAGEDISYRVQPHFKCNSGGGLVDAAIKGLGIIQLPDHYVKPYIDTGKLTTVLDKFAGGDEGIWLLYPESRRVSSKVRALIDYLLMQNNLK